MTEPAFACVIDANVVLKLYLRQVGSERVEALFALLEASAQTRFYAPDLLYAECTNAFSNYARLEINTAQQARDDMFELRQLGLYVVPTVDLAEKALEIALKHKISGYDACYVALADQVKAPLITADEKLVRSLAGKEYPVQALATFRSPPEAASGK